MLDIAEMSPAERATYDGYLRDVMPSTLPTAPRTWRSLKSMGVDLDRGDIQFVDDGTHIQRSYLQYWGWWKVVVLGWYPYTELRDIEAHERQGLGRPWLRLLPELWQEVIFRELILLVDEWNDVVGGDDARVEFVLPEEQSNLIGTPEWLERWLSLTNESWRRGAVALERELYEVADPTAAEVASLLARYRASSLTWRPMMPDRAKYHQKYGKRGAYWSFERGTD